MAKHCFTNLITGAHKLKLTLVFQICNEETFSKLLGEVTGQLAQNLLAVCGSLLILLFSHDNALADLIIGIDHRKIDGSFRALPRLLQYIHIVMDK